MTAKPVVPREQANQDVDDAVSYYLGEDAPDAALGFIDALEAAYRHIAKYPAPGHRAMRTHSTCRVCASGRSNTIRIWFFTWNGQTISTSGAYCMRNETFQHGCRNPTNRPIT